ncbi:ribosomal protein L13 [Desulfurobacterium thermolithotrophum DSM 11699]|uniref:Large ribosomal subunit protein uL13 n=1 Tax=Desulfurobacterium thermolithotrophum (strain DSM 11699 / BSA) TaxID=868864 RepID=F0S115_DESTD|nr:50S ribosomal protein L13 [Desulfurobacterium thermolithotrophum]ADY73893.1 ribosomal protein L13 [Desulfurobacterium thermolithotrophum DSM 11699]
MKTFMLKKEEVQRDWYVVDATGKTLGRLASEIAKILIGKHKPTYTPHVDNGDFVIVINAEKIHVTGKKLDKKIYYKHTGYMGHLKETTLKEMLQKKPEEVIKLAVRGMLPKNKLRDRRMKRLKVYAAPTHPHSAQNPKPLEL